MPAGSTEGGLHGLPDESLLEPPLLASKKLGLLSFGRRSGSAPEPRQADELEDVDVKTLEDKLLTGFSAAFGAPVNADLRQYVARGSGRLPDTAEIVSWDANSIHGYVFDTMNATGIRGASDILRTIDETLKGGRELGIAPEQVLFAGGGSGLAVVSKRDSEACLRALHRLFAERTLVATCSAVAVPLSSEPDSFGAIYQKAGQMLARQRALSGPDAEPAVPFFAERCEVCGRRAAAAHRPRRHRPRFECRPCEARVDHGGRVRRDQEEPSDYAEIADGKGKGFYAVVYLDGNGMGQVLAKLKSPLEYATLSEAIDSVLREAFDATAARFGLIDETSEQSGGRYQLPICGGDDLVAILPGNVAVPFTRDLLETLEQRFDGHPALSQLGVGQLGAAAGVAIAHIKYPIRHLIAEAEALLKTRAKARVYRDEARSALDFSVITDGSPRVESLPAERWSKPSESMLLSGRPYSLQEMGEFTNRIRTVLGKRRDLGRSQLYALRRVAERGPALLRNHVLYQVGRRSEWRSLIGALSGGADGVLQDKARCMAQVVPTYGGRSVFDIADMIELSEHWKEAGV
jgi:hypothetical protein